MDRPEYNTWLHRIAVLTACVALVPILLGALVTTKDAGMAFPDWPNSDGHNMLFYPWLKSAGAKFLEHGHRLAGIVIGIMSIALAFVAGRSEPRVWVRRMAYGILAAVVAQGILGGQRVLLDQRGLAFVHGSFAALVLALMAGLAVVTSRAWHEASARDARPRFARLGILALVTCLFIFVQYVLGGLLRHRGMALHEHVGFAFVAALMTVWLAISAASSSAPWLRAPAAGLAVLTIGQLALGAGAWVTKFGFGSYVAVYGSPIQDTMRTAHVLCGMFLFVTTVVLAVRIARLHWLSAAPAGSDAASLAFDAPLPLPGGAR